MLHLLAYCLHLDLSEPVAFPGRSTDIKRSCSYIIVEHYYLFIIQVFPLDLKETSNTAQALFGVRGLKEIGEATLALCGSSAVLWLLTETDENTQHSLTAFDLSLQVIYTSVSGFCELLSMTLMGKGAQTSGWLFMPLKTKKAPKNAPGKTMYVPPCGNRASMNA